MYTVNLEMKIFFKSIIILLFIIVSASSEIVREIKVINLEEVSDKFEVEDVYGNVTIHEHKTK